MNLDEGKKQFIDSWGQLGINWGVNKTMGQVHALGEGSEALFQESRVSTQ